MYKNGISHLVAASDLDGALQIVQYLMFVPERKGKAIPILTTGDSWDRSVDWKPTKAAYDPRNFLAGCFEEVDGQNVWKSGILDHGSFFETMGKSSDYDARMKLMYRWLGTDHCHWSWSSQRYPGCGHRSRDPLN